MAGKPNNDDNLRDALRRSWERNGPAWAHAIRTGAIASRADATDAAILAVISHHMPRCVLDCGCGEGWLVRTLTEAGVAATGIDASAALIDSARLSGGGRFLCVGYAALAEESTLCPGPFDLTVFNFSLLDDRIDEALVAARQRLAPHGHVVIQTVHPLTQSSPYQDGWRHEDFRSIAGDDWSPMPWYFRTLESWVAAAAATGLRLAALHEPRAKPDADPTSLVLVLSRAENRAHLDHTQPTPVSATLERTTGHHRATTDSARAVA